MFPTDTQGIVSTSRLSRRYMTLAKRRADVWNVSCHSFLRLREKTYGIFEDA